MSVYVDQLLPCASNRFWRYRESCHLTADSREELHAFAFAIDLWPSWFQGKPGHVPHYDLTRGMRAKALAAGAVELTQREAADRIRAWRLSQTAAGPHAPEVC
jgi:glycine/D-amino acid oxidase-like deaminating enzyme